MILVFDRIENVVGKGESGWKHCGKRRIGLKTLWEKENRFENIVGKGESGWKHCGKRRIRLKTLWEKENRAENIVGKGENVGYQHFPLFP